MKRKLFRQEAGFTLIEIMVVVVILGILAAIVVPKILSRPAEARKTQAEVQIQNLKSALGMYKLDNGKYPTTEQGLQALVEKPSAAPVPKSWRNEGYLDQIPRDPWGNEYVYLSPGAHGEFDLYSLGADGEQGGEGIDEDITSWSRK